MANINNEQLFNQQLRAFRALGARTDRFREDYVDCVNDVISLINLYADLETHIDFISTTEGSIGLSDLYRYPFSQLVTLRLYEQGQRPANGGETYYATLVRDKTDYVDQCRQGIINAATESDTDDDTTDIVGLGALG